MLQMINPKTSLCALNDWADGYITDKIDPDDDGDFVAAILNSIDMEKVKRNLQDWFSNNVCECCGMIIGNEIDKPCTA